MGVAYAAQDLRSGKKVIIKVPQLTGTADMHLDAYKRTMGRFAREARMLRALRHPNIPEVVGEGEYESVPYIAMTYIQGHSLTHYRENNVPRQAEFAVIGTSVAKTLAACHSKKVLHRDLKPDNLMIGENGVVYVIDFGIALPLDADATRYTNNIVGTDAYTAPERFRDDKQVEQSDLYSLGCVFYYLLTARPPFVEAGGKSWRQQHLEDVPVPPSRLGSRVPRDVEDLTLGLLAKNAEERPAINQVVATLAPYLPAKGAPEPNPVLEPDVTIPYRTTGSVRPPEAPSRSRRTTALPFTARRRHDFVTDADITAAVQLATTQHDNGDTAAAVQTLTDLQRRAMETFGVRSPRLALIESELARLAP